MKILGGKCRSITGEPVFSGGTGENELQFFPDTPFFLRNMNLNENLFTGKGGTW